MKIPKKQFEYVLKSDDGLDRQVMYFRADTLEDAELIIFNELRRRMRYRYNVEIPRVTKT